MSAEDETKPTVEDEDIFAGLKKKKKKSKDKKEKPTGVEEVEEDLENLDFGKKKKSSKKKKSAKSTSFEQALQEEGISEVAETGDTQLENYGLPYEDLLERFFKILKANNPELAGERSEKLKIPPPVVSREAKKTIFSNIKLIAQKLNRDPEHVIHYLFAELGTSGSVDGKEQLIIKGKFQQKQLEGVLKKYIFEYVTCKTCKSVKTTLIRQNANRLYFLVCKSCGSSRSVSSIKTGFTAQIGRRRRAA